MNLLADSNTIIRKEDRLVLLARDYEHTSANPKAPVLPAIGRERAPAHESAVTGTHRVLVLGWNRRVPTLIAEFASYNNRTFELNLVSAIPVKEREREIRRYGIDLGRVSGRLLEADYMVEEDMRRLEPAGYDTVMLLSSDRAGSGEEADARAMVGYLQLEDMLTTTASRPQIIMELSDPDNRHLLYGHKSEMLISPMILSHVLAQVALRRELRVVLDELFTVGGVEIQFRDARDYPLPASATFQLVEKIVAAKSEVALGVLRVKADSRGRHLQLNPLRDGYLDLQAGDQLVVLCRT